MWSPAITEAAGNGGLLFFLRRASVRAGRGRSTNAMQNDPTADDRRAIEALIARQFASLNWTPQAPADWRGFAADFAPGALLYPAARPAKRQTVEDFVERMQGLVGAPLQSFHERVLGTEIRIFGNVALAVAACEVTENGTDISRSVEMLLLVKDEGQWRIVSQAWDRATTENPVPEIWGGSD
jgi:hypothetical protein